MTNEFEAKFVWANSDGKVFVIFVLSPLREQESGESSINCRLERFVEYRSGDGDRISDLTQVPGQARQQIEALLGSECPVQKGVRLGAIKYIESPAPPPPS